MTVGPLRVTDEDLQGLGAGSTERPALPSLERNAANWCRAISESTSGQVQVMAASMRISPSLGGARTPAHQVRTQLEPALGMSGTSSARERSKATRCCGVAWALTTCEWGTVRLPAATVGLWGRAQPGADIGGLMRPDGERTALQRATNTRRGWPRWARVAAPVTVGLLLFSCSSGSSEDTEPAEADATTTTVLTADELVEESTIEGLTTDDLIALVDRSCQELNTEQPTEDAVEAVYAELEDLSPDVTVAQVAEVADVIGDAAPQLCPDGVRSHPDFISGLAAAAPTPTTTTTTIPPTTAAPTTAPPTTAAPTTAPPPPPTTAAPPPPPPPPPPAPAPAPSGVNYANCTEVREAGAAPIRIGEPGYSTKLDRDGDGIACET